MQVLPGQVLPPGVREQLNGPIILPSMYLRRATQSFQVHCLTLEQHLQHASLKLRWLSHPAAHVPAPCHPGLPGTMPDVAEREWRDVPAAIDHPQHQRTTARIKQMLMFSSHSVFVLATLLNQAGSIADGTSFCLQEALEQYRSLVVQLEALLPQQGFKAGGGGNGQQQDGRPSAVAALPVVLHNLHDFFNHVAARLEKLHEGVAATKEAFLERRREVHMNMWFPHRPNSPACCFPVLTCTAGAAGAHRQEVARCMRQAAAEICLDLWQSLHSSIEFFKWVVFFAGRRHERSVCGRRAQGAAEAEDVAGEDDRDPAQHGRARGAAGGLCAGSCRAGSHTRRYTDARGLGLRWTQWQAHFVPPDAFTPVREFARSVFKQGPIMSMFLFTTGGGLFGGGTQSSLFGASAPAASAAVTPAGGGLFAAPAAGAWGAPAASPPNNTAGSSRRGRLRK